MLKKTFTGKDLVAATGIITLGVLIGLGHNSALLLIFVEILVVYGLVRAARKRKGAPPWQGSTNPRLRK